MANSTDTPHTTAEFDMMTAHGVMHCTLAPAHADTQSE